MSHSPSIYRFVDGDDVPVPLDLVGVRALLEPHDAGDPQLTVGEDGSLRFWIRASGGGAAEISVDETGILVERPQNGGVLAVLAELVAELGAVVIDPAAAELCAVRRSEHNSPRTCRRTEVIVIDTTGDALVDALTGPTRRASQ
ncbi:hypothetical protein [Streptomyces sp. NPDC058735]|uniref:hypothetical protein n=1 Tax=unclassified Streptomyces TaxID=2593676 RepID=UPI00369AC52A